jgi:hypothetical protein
VCKSERTINIRYILDNVNLFVAWHTQHVTICIIIYMFTYWFMVKLVLEPWSEINLPNSAEVWTFKWTETISTYISGGWRYKWKIWISHVRLQLCSLFMKKLEAFLTPHLYLMVRFIRSTTHKIHTRRSWQYFCTCEQYHSNCKPTTKSTKQAKQQPFYAIK